MSRLLARLASAAPFALVASAGVLTLAADRAEAQLFGFFEPPPRAERRDYRSYRSPRPRIERRVRRERPAQREAVREREVSKPIARDDNDNGVATSKAAKAPPPQMVYAVVSLASQHIKVYGAEGQIARSRVSSGQAGFATPTGIFGILEKHRDHESNIYEGAEMPFMQRLTWSGVALHQGVVPRYPASHGCIRLPAAFAAQLWDMTKVGARVVVSSRDVEPVEFSHSMLPVARMATPDVLGLQSADAAGSAPDTDRPVQVAAAGDSNVVPLNSRRYNPVEVAGLLKARAQAEVRTATKTAEQGRADARVVAAEANDAAEAVRDAKSDLADARANNAMPDTIAEIERRLAAAEAVDAERAPRALAAAVRVRDAERAAEAARETASTAHRRLAPLSVLISAKEGLVVVKQAHKPVYEAPFTLRDPQTPLGTHLFVATAPVGDDGTLRWSALTIPDDAKSGKGRGKDETAAAPAEPSSAGEALDRITLSPQTQQTLSELAWVGASIIVTDRGVGADFGEHTDMVVAIP